MVQGKNTDDDGSYYITHITDEAAQRYNKVIHDNAEEFVIINADDEFDPPEVV